VPSANQVEQGIKTRLGLCAEPAAPAQLRAQRHQDVEHHADASEVFAGESAAALVRLTIAAAAGRRSPGR